MTVKEDRRARIQKMMGGGASEASPKISAEKFLPSGGKGEYISSNQARSLQVVNVKLGSISNTLKDSLVLSKVRMGIERRKAEELRRKKREKELEKSKKKDKPKGQTKGLKVPFMDRVSNFLITFLWGSIVMSLMDMGNNPKVSGFMNGLATAGKNILTSAQWLVEGLMFLIDWGYKIYDTVRGFISNVFGEKGVAVFDALSGVLNKVANALGVIGLIFLKFRKFFTGLIKNTFKIFRRGLGKAFKRLSIKLFGKGGGKIAQNIGKVASKVANFGKNIGGKLLSPLKSVGSKALNLAKGVGGKLAGVGKNLLGAGKGLATKGASKVGGFAAKIFGKAAKVIAPAMKSAKPFLGKFFGRIPIIGPLVVGIVSILSGDPVGKALFKTIGAALGGALGTFIPIPVIGTLLGEAIGVWFGDMLYTLMFGGGLSAVGAKLREQLLGVLNVGKAVGKFVSGGFSRFWDGIPKIKIPDLPKEPPQWIPGFGFGSKKKIWNAIRGALKLLIGPFSLLMGREIPNLLWLYNPMNTGPLLVKSFFPPGGEEEGSPSMESIGTSGEPSAGGLSPQQQKEEEKARKKEEMKKKIGEVKEKIGGFFSKVGKGLKNLGKKVIGKEESSGGGSARGRELWEAHNEKKQALKDRVAGVSSKASYEQGAGEGSGGFIPLPLTGGGLPPNPYTSSSGGGGGSSSEDSNDPLLLLYMGK